MDLLIPKTEVTPAVLEALAAEGYVRIVSAIELEEDEFEVMCFSKISIPSDMAALRLEYETGSEGILALQSSEELERILGDRNYIISEKTRVVSGEQQLHYYRKQFNEQSVDVKLHVEYLLRSKRNSILKVPEMVYDMKYKSFVVQAEKQQWHLPLQNGMRQQNLGISLVVDILGSSKDHSILMQVSSFMVGVFREHFHKDDHLLGFFPESVTLTLKPKATTGAIVPCYIDRDTTLSLVLDHQIAKKSSEEYRADWSIKAPVGMSLGAGATFREADNSGVRSTVVTPVNFGEVGSASLHWAIVTWADKRPFHSDKPHKAMSKSGEFPSLPFVGTGPVITGMERIKWSCSDASMIPGLKFEVRIETMMVLLRKKTVVNLCGLGKVGFSAESVRVKVPHCAEMELVKA